MVLEEMGWEAVEWINMVWYRKEFWGSFEHGNKMSVFLDSREFLD
jgi:hypothetical protein